MELVDGMMLRKGEAASFRKAGHKLELRDLDTSDEEFMRLLRIRVANTAKAFAEAVDPQDVYRAYVLHMAMLGIFDRFSGYSGQVDHDIRKAMSHGGSRDKFYVLVSHAK